MKHPLLQYQILCDANRYGPAEYLPAHRAGDDDGRHLFLFDGNTYDHPDHHLRAFRHCYCIIGNIIRCHYRIACHGDAALHLLMPRLIADGQRCREPGADPTESGGAGWMLQRLSPLPGAIARLRADIDPLLRQYERDGRERMLTADPAYFRTDAFAVVAADRTVRQLERRPA